MDTGSSASVDCDFSCTRGNKVDMIIDELEQGAAVVADLLQQDCHREVGRLLRRNKHWPS
jgi:hypothetical protein